MLVLRICLLLIVASLPLALVGCMSPKGSTADEKRSYVRQMRNETLSEIYQQKPELEAEVRSAVGYAVFSNFSMRIFVVGPGQGYGLLVENATGDETFMRMGELGAGIGMGARSLRALFIFRDPQTLARFRDSGWQFGGDADVAAKAGDVGGAAAAQGRAVEGGASVGGSGSVGAQDAGAGQGAGMTVYQFTETGLALAAGVSGTKYWKDSSLQ